MKHWLGGLLVVIVASAPIGGKAQTPAGDDAARGKTHLINGLVALERGDVNAALRELRQATVLLPNIGRLHYEYGRALAEDGDTEEAIREFRLASQLSPDDPDPHFALATILTRVASTRPEAITEYRAALRLRPDHPESRRGLGNALLLTQQIEMLKATASAMVAGGMTDKQRAYTQSLFSKSPQAQAGFAELRKAIELAPRWAQPHHDLAAAMKLFGDPRGALKEYQLACNLEPTNERFCADYRNALSER